MGTLFYLLGGRSFYPLVGSDLVFILPLSLPPLSAETLVFILPLRLSEAEGWVCGCACSRGPPYRDLSYPVLKPLVNLVPTNIVLTWYRLSLLHAVL